MRQEFSKNGRSAYHSNFKLIEGGQQRTLQCALYMGERYESTPAFQL